MVLTEHSCWPQVGFSHLSLALPLDNDSFRIVVGIRPGTPLCCPHQCWHCVERRWMSWAIMALAAGGVKGDITGMLL